MVGGNLSYKTASVAPLAWLELRYLPCQAAVDAGVSGAMCSYNRVGDEYACGNGGTLARDLKGKMGFRH